MRSASKEERPRWLGFWLALAGVTVAGACSGSTFSAAGCKGDECAGSGGKGGSGQSGGRGGRNTGGSAGSSTGGSEGGAPDTGGTGGSQSGGSDPGAGRGGSTGGKGGSASGKGGSSAGKVGSSGGRAGSGGSEAGGADNGGTGAAGSGTGGDGGTGGAGNGGSSGAQAGGGAGQGGGGQGGTGGSAVTGGTAGLVGIGGGISIDDFPFTGVLDDFNRAAAELGPNWTGSTGNYSLSSGRALCAETYCPGAFWHEQFGPVQEVFATLAGFDSSSLEINLVLKAQGDPDCDMIEILYSPASQHILVEACSGDGWYTLGTIEESLAPGDQLGGRARSDGYLDVYKNGSLVGTVSAGGYPFINLSGYIGINGVVVDDGEPNLWDDFGGGEL